MYFDSESASEIVEILIGQAAAFDEQFASLDQNLREAVSDLVAAFLVSALEIARGRDPSGYDADSLHNLREFIAGTGAAGLELVGLGVTILLARRVDTAFSLEACGAQS